MIVVLSSLGAVSRAEAAGAQKLMRMIMFIVGYDASVTNAKVGYHVAGMPQTSCPAYWDRHGDAQGSGEWGYSGVRVTSGQLPPGLTFTPGTGRIEGTPQEPGDWSIMLKFDGLYCHLDGQHGQVFDMEHTRGGDGVFNVAFHIQGDAPRGVN